MVLAILKKVVKRRRRLASLDGNRRDEMTENFNIYSERFWLRRIDLSTRFVTEAILYGRLQDFENIRSFRSQPLERLDQSLRSSMRHRQHVNFWSTALCVRLAQPRLNSMEFSVGDAPMVSDWSAC